MGGGERGIRTPGTTFGSTRDFQSRSLSQLGHLSSISLVLRTRCLCHLSGFWQKNRLSSTSEFLRNPCAVSQWRKAPKLLWAERVGFEPTCLALNETNRFRVDPVTTTSVPLRRKRYFFRSAISFP
jgi:hypothetical protein